MIRPDIELGCVLLVAPEVPFRSIAAALGELGWRREDPESAHGPLVTGEPELAAWSWNGRRPHAIYTFNPIARLRSLDVGSAPPALRGAIASRLPLLHPEGLARLLMDREPRRRLLGLWAALETERVDLARAAASLLDDTEPTVAEQAARVVERLETIARARIEVLRALRLAAEDAGAVLARLNDVDFVLSLLPTREEGAELFESEILEAIVAGVARLHAAPPRADPGELYPELEVTAATAGLLRSPNELSARFPTGYRRLAGWMEPAHLWLTWSWRAPGGSAVRYDGLARVGERWVWIPKPFRIAGSLVGDEANPAPERRA